jgi:hypothetical protein
MHPAAQFRVGSYATHTFDCIGVICKTPVGYNYVGTRNLYVQEMVDDIHAVFAGYVPRVGSVNGAIGEGRLKGVEASFPIVLEFVEEVWYALVRAIIWNSYQLGRGGMIRSTYR